MGIVVAECWAEGLRNWRCVSKRFVMIRQNIKAIWMTIIQVHAATDDKDDQGYQRCYIIWENARDDRQRC